MTSCSEFELLISMQLDGELSPAEAASLENHLHTCADCRALQAELLLLQDDFSALRAAPPAGLVAGAMGRIAAEAGTQTPKVTPFPSKKKTYRRWLASAAVFCFLVSAVLLFRPGSNSPDGISLANEESAPMQATMEYESDEGAVTQKDAAADIRAIESEPQSTAGSDANDGSFSRSDAPAAPMETPPVPEPSAPAAPASEAPAPEEGSATTGELALPESIEEDAPTAALSEPFELRDVPPQDADSALGITMPQQPLNEDDARALLLAYLAEEPTPASEVSLTELDESRDVYRFLVSYPDGTQITYEVSRADGSICPTE